MGRLRLVIMTTLFFVVPGTAAAEEVSVSELITNSEAMSRSEVTVEGELVGDYGFRGDGWMWTQLNGDAYVRSPIREGDQPLSGTRGSGLGCAPDLAKGWTHRAVMAAAVR